MMRNILNWVDAHTNLPIRARWIAKADVAPYRATKRTCVDPPRTEGFLFSESAIAKNLIQAYLDTDFRVHTDPPFVLKMGVSSEPLNRLFRQYQCECAAYLTACNPFSRNVGDADNEARQAALAKELTGRNLKFIVGKGQDSQDKWPGEASFLVFALSLESSRALARKYEQNAFIWCASDAVPELVLLR